MKKLMMFAMVAFSAIAVNAASYNWQTATFGEVYLPDTNTKLASATAYLFECANAAAADDILATCRAGNDWTKGSLSHSDINNGAISSTGNAFPYGELNLSAIFAVVTKIGDKDYMYLSTIKAVEGSDQGTTTIIFNEKTTSQAAASGLSDTYSDNGAGWYEVPEPTSGMLMLLGFAGLALRRKRV